MVLAKWERYRDGCLTPNNYNASAIALQLWDCCPNDLQTILRSNGLGNQSTKPKMLDKIKAVTVTTQNVLVNVNNFLCMRQWKAESVRLNLGRLKVKARHYDFHLLTGLISYTDKMILHTLAQGLENAAIAKDIIEKCATNYNLQNCLTLKKIEKLVEAKKHQNEHGRAQ